MDAPAHAACAPLAGPQRWPQWHAACRQVHSPGPGPPPAGAAFDRKAAPATLHSMVTQSVPGQAFRYTAASADLHAEHTFTLTTTRTAPECAASRPRPGRCPPPDGRCPDHHCTAPRSSGWKTSPRQHPPRPSGPIQGPAPGSTS